MTHWFATGESTIPPGLAWLTPREAERASGHRFTKRRTEYLLRRWAGKQAVAAALGLPLTSDAAIARIALLNHAGGAPFVEVDGAPAPVDISLTDRAGHAVALVGPVGAFAAGTIGVDLEIVEPRSTGFVADFLTPAEASWVRACGPPGSTAWDAAANLAWSAKEAALKVLRVGLRADTRSVEVSAPGWPVPTGPDGWGALTVRHAASGRVFPGWWRRDGVHLLTLTTVAAAPPPGRLPGSLDLEAAVPTHSWLAHPLVDGPG